MTNEGIRVVTSVRDSAPVHSQHGRDRSLSVEGRGKAFPIRRIRFHSHSMACGRACPWAWNWLGPQRGACDVSVRTDRRSGCASTGAGCPRTRAPERAAGCTLPRSESAVRGGGAVTRQAVRTPGRRARGRQPSPGNVAAGETAVPHPALGRGRSVFTRHDRGAQPAPTLARCCRSRVRTTAWIGCRK